MYDSGYVPASTGMLAKIVDAKLYCLLASLFLPRAFCCLFCGPHCKFYISRNCPERPASPSSASQGGHTCSRHCPATLVRQVLCSATALLLSGIGTGVWAQSFGYWSLFSVCITLCLLGAVLFAVAQPQR